MRLTIILPFLLIVNLSCKMNDRITSSESHLESDKKGGILFLNFKIEMDSSESINITLTNNNWVLGSFKETDPPFLSEDNMLEFQFLDKNQKLLKKTLVANPLNASHEAFALNGTIERKEISLEQVEFTLRANAPQTVAYIRVNDSSGIIALLKLK